LFTLTYIYFAYKNELLVVADQNIRSLTEENDDSYIIYEGDNSYKPVGVDDEELAIKVETNCEETGGKNGENIAVNSFELEAKS
jgi:hypothetical protein